MNSSGAISMKFGGVYMLKRVLSLILLFTMILASLPMEDMIVYAVGEPVVKPEITNIEFKTIKTPKEGTKEGKIETKYIVHALNAGDKAVLVIGSKEYDYEREGKAYVVKKTDANRDDYIWIYDEVDPNITFKIGTEDGVYSDPITFKLEMPPNIKGVSKKDKVYVGEDLMVEGHGFKDEFGSVDSVVVGGFAYTHRKIQGASETLEDIKKKADDGLLDPGTFYITKDEGSIYIPSVYDAASLIPTNITVIKKLKDPGDDSVDNKNFLITSIYDIKQRIVKRIEYLDPDKISIIPNRGPKEGGTKIKIYDHTTGPSKLSNEMKILIGNKKTPEYVPLKDIELIYDEENPDKILGITAVTPPSPTNKQGIFNIMLTDGDGFNEQILEQAYTYEEAENLMSLSAIHPTKGKKDDIVEIRGQNIFDLNVSYITPDSVDLDLAVISLKNGNLLVKYNGVEYTKGETPVKVNVEREIKTIIGRKAEAVYTGPGDVSLDKYNKYKVKVPDSSEYGDVTVTVNVSTTIYDLADKKLDYIEEEASLPDAFELLPANIIPIIEKVEPLGGDIREDIFMTLRGDKFLVMAEFEDHDMDPSTPKKLKSIYPTVTIGHKKMVVTGVYDKDNKEINGVGNQIGVAINGYIKGGEAGDSYEGPVDITVRNPDSGEATKAEMFDYQAHSRLESQMPRIREIKPDIGPITGGNIIKIIGDNFDLESSTPEIQVTIGGQLCEIVNANSEEIEIKVPKGFEFGEQPVQVIASDGAMDTIKVDDTRMNGYTYIKSISEPEIIDIAPAFGGKGTIVYIAGKDKGPDKPTFFKSRNLKDELDKNIITPEEYAALVNSIRADELIGTRVYLNGIDINTKKEDGEDDIYEIVDDIIKDDDKDGNIFNGTNRVEFIDDNLIRITIPGGYYPGLKDLKILNPDSSTCTVKEGFRYMKPAANAEVEITDIIPRLGSASGGDYITIKGKGFKNMINDDGSSPLSLTVYFKNKKAPVVQFINDTELKVKTPEFPLKNPDETPYEIVSVQVINPDGSSYIEKNEVTPTGWKGFKFIAPLSVPMITSVSPKEGSTLGGNKVTITGSDFRTYDPKDGNPKILPKVFFGGIEAKVLGSSFSQINVEAPFYGREEWVDITVKNPDEEFGVITANKAYHYKASKPEIISVFPEKAGKKGGEFITVKGKDIVVGDFSDSIQVVGDTEFEPIIDVLAIFQGERLKDSTLTGYKTLDLGDVEVDFKEGRNETIDGVEVKDNIVLKIDGKLAAHHNMKINEMRIFVIDWKAQGKEELAQECVVVELRDGEIIAYRRVSAHAKVSTEVGSDIAEVYIKTPPAATVGIKQLIIENKDRGKATIPFEYVNALSKPVIESISPSREIKTSLGVLEKYYVESSIKGGLYMTIEGYDLKKDAEVFVDGVPAEIVSRLDYDIQDTLGRKKSRIVAKVPAGNTSKLNKELKITVVNKDGSFVDSDDVTRLVPKNLDTPVPYYFVYRIPESNPVIEAIIPLKTSQHGGNRVKIVGYDFRTGLMVLIDGVSCQVESVNNDEIIFITPSTLQPGIADVQVINADFGSVTSLNGIDIISYPTITAVSKEDGTTINRVSIEGGEKILIVGKNIYEGVKVYFGGERKEISPSEKTTEVRGLYKDDKYYNVLEASEAKEVKYVSKNTILVTLPEVFKEGEYAITLVNADGGISDESKDINYRVPIPSDPVGLEAEVVNDKYIRIYGYTSTNASYYEIYVYVGDDTPGYDEFEYIDTTTKNSYRITKLEDLDNDDEIYIKVRAVNKYGPSLWSNTARISENELDDVDQIGDEDRDGDLVSNYQEQVAGNKANITLGNKELSKSSYMYYIDLNHDKYRHILKTVVNIPVNIIEDESNPIMVDRGSMRLQLSPSNFKVNSLYAMTNSERQKAYGSLILDSTQNRFTENAGKALPRTKVFVSNIVKVGSEINIGKTKVNMNSIKGSMNLEIRYNKARIVGLKESSLQIYRYDMSNLKWVPLAGGMDKDKSIVYSRIYGPGYYAIIGNR